MGEVGVADLIQTFGIGGVLAFVLIRLESKLDANTNAIDRLTLDIELLLDRNRRATEHVAEVLEHQQPRPRPGPKRSAGASRRGSE